MTTDVARERSIPIGTLDGDAPTFVDPSGALELPSGGRVSWCVIAEDRLHDPTDSTTVRQMTDGAIVETTVRIVSGDAVVRVFAVPGGVVCEVENASAAACAFAVIAESSAELVHGPRPASQSCVADSRATVVDRLARGATEAGPPRSGRVAASVWPVAHRSSLRIFVGHRRPAELASADDVRRAWSARLANGMRVDVADRVLQDAIDQARVAVLVEAPCADVEITRALEDWGFDSEAAIAWEQLGFGDRRRLRHRRSAPGAWDRLVQAQSRRPSATLLNAVHDVLLAPRGRTIEILPEFPSAWLGLNLAATDIPLRGGAVSFAVRWHGERPALLWEAAADVELRSPVLGPTWATRERSGEVLFDPPPLNLLGTAESLMSAIGESPPSPASFS
jgi:hypothetical protein